MLHLAFRFTRSRACLICPPRFGPNVYDCIHEENEEMLVAPTMSCLASHSYPLYSASALHARRRAAGAGRSMRGCLSTRCWWVTDHATVEGWRFCSVPCVVRRVSNNRHKPLSGALEGVVRQAEG